MTASPFLASVCVSGKWGNREKSVMPNCCLIQSPWVQGRVLALMTLGVPQAKSLSTCNLELGALGTGLWVREHGKGSGSDL